MKKRYWIPAAMAVLLGALFAFGYTPMRFSGYLLFAAAVFLLLWGFLAGRRGKLAKVLWRVLLACLMLGLGVFTVLETQVIRYGRTDRETAVSAVVILGAGVNGTVPSLSLQVRLEAALDYLQDKPDIPIVVTGSQGPGEDISEARCMADWLMARGISEDRILLEDQADNTEENIQFSRELLADKGIDLTDNIAVVTSDYHLYRASLLWGGPGMVPVAAHMPSRFFALTVNYYIREAFAAAELLVFG